MFWYLNKITFLRCLQCLSGVLLCLKKTICKFIREHHCWGFFSLKLRCTKENVKKRHLENFDRYLSLTNPINLLGEAFQRVFRSVEHSTQSQSYLFILWAQRPIRDVQVSEVRITSVSAENKLRLVQGWFLHGRESSLDKTNKVQIRCK